MTLFLLLVTVLATSSTTRALQVHVLTRHGARSPLIKNADDLAESGGELTLVGYKQQEELGQWLRQRYPEPLFDEYRFTSSPTQRTLVSAQGLATGLFAGTDGALPPPIYSVRPVNDILIRPYDKCPVFHDKLTRLYEFSDEWRLLQDSALGLLATLANAFPQYAQGAAIPLKDVWNVFDLMDVARSACENDVDDDDNCLAHYQAMADVLSTDDWDRLRVLAHQAEHIKYSMTGGTLLGSPLVSHIVETMNQADSDSSSLHVYSGHYPTILSVLATLQLQLPAAEVVPPLASALILELDGDSVTVAYKPGDAPTSTTLLTLSRRDLQQRLARSQHLPTDIAWCRACENDTADVCLLVSNASSSRGSIGVRTTLVLWMVLTLVASVLVVRWRRKVRKMVDSANRPVVQSPAGEAELTEVL